jgi:hypothetical protein
VKATIFLADVTLLEVDVNGMNKNQVTLAKNKVKLNMKEPYTSEKRQEIFESWLRKGLRARISILVEK